MNKKTKKIMLACLLATLLVGGATSASAYTSWIGWRATIHDYDIEVAHSTKTTRSNVWCFRVDSRTYNRNIKAWLERSIGGENVSETYRCGTGKHYDIPYTSKYKNKTNFYVVLNLEGVGFDKSFDAEGRWSADH